MSARVTLLCDALGCRVGVTVETAVTAQSARHLSTAEGWSSRQVHGRVIDACPTCTAVIAKAVA